MYTFLYTQYAFACTQSPGSQVAVVSFLGDTCQWLETFLFVLAEVWGAPGICGKKPGTLLIFQSPGQPMLFGSNVSGTEVEVRYCGVHF